ncbi:MAG TPA: hypothetical protein ENG33_11540, partial [Chloroflexi bacterium]|nr:hypothetical protein [Chloroflexota bacterium]
MQTNMPKASRQTGPGWLKWVITFLPITLIAALIAFVYYSASLPQAPAPPTLSPSPQATRASLEQFAGKIAFKSDRDGKEAIYVMNPDGSGQTKLEDEALYHKALAREALSPDRTRAAFVRYYRDNQEIFVRHLQSMWTWRLTQNPGPDYEPAWSPDGLYLAYVSQVKFNDEIKVSRFDGGEERLLTSDLQFTDRHPSWSPDGKRIVFWSDREGGRRQIWVMDSEGSNLRNISNSPYNDWDPVWIKPLPLPTPTPTPGGPADLEVVIALKECTSEGEAILDFGAWDNTGGTVPVSRAILEVDGISVYDSGPLQADRLQQTVNLNPGIRGQAFKARVSLKVWNEGKYIA